MAEVADDMADGVGSHGVVQSSAHRALHLASAPRVHQGQAAALIGAGQLSHVIPRQGCSSRQGCGLCIKVGYCIVRKH